jgi:tRNA-dihydrouridine synthase A
MRSAVRIPVTVKHRLGVDEMNQHSDLAHFVDVVARAPADRLIVHARQALLHGISPKDNRTVPPLNHQAVFALKAARPALAIELNGGVGSLEEAEALLACGVDGVMIGRAAYTDPWLFADADRRIYGRAANPASAGSRADALRSLEPHAAALHAAGQPMHRLTRHLPALLKGLPHSRRMRQMLSQPSDASATPPGPGLLMEVAELVAAAEKGEYTASLAGGQPLLQAAERVGGYPFEDYEIAAQCEHHPVPVRYVKHTECIYFYRDGG